MLRETAPRRGRGLQRLLHSARAAFALALMGMGRVHQLCTAPHGLSTWALELLHEQASQVPLSTITCCLVVVQACMMRAGVPSSLCCMPKALGCYPLLQHLLLLRAEIPSMYAVMPFIGLLAV